MEISVNLILFIEKSIDCYRYIKKMNKKRTKNGKLYSQKDPKTSDLSA